MLRRFAISMKVHCFQCCYSLRKSILNKRPIQSFVRYTWKIFCENSCRRWKNRRTEILFALWWIETLFLMKQFFLNMNECLLRIYQIIRRPYFILKYFPLSVYMMIIVRIHFIVEFFFKWGFVRLISHIFVVLLRWNYILCVMLSIIHQVYWKDTYTIDNMCLSLWWSIYYIKSPLNCML